MTDTLYVIDLDRTLIGMDEVMSLTERTCAETGIDYSDIEKAMYRSTEIAQPYSPLRTIEAMGGSKLVDFKRKFLELADTDLLVFPDARRYLDRLKYKSRQYMILTYASEAEWQVMKMKAAGLAGVPRIITFDQYKGREIAGWLNPDGRFAVPLKDVPEAARIVFIDDRARVFIDLPDGCTGYMIDRFDYDVQAELPAAVQRIKSFDEIIDKI